jgi:hypothetical protein
MTAPSRNQLLGFFLLLSVILCLLLARYLRLFWRWNR